MSSVLTAAHLLGGLFFVFLATQYHGAKSVGCSIVAGLIFAVLALRVHTWRKP